MILHWISRIDNTYFRLTEIGGLFLFGGLITRQHSLVTAQTRNDQGSVLDSAAEEDAGGDEQSLPVRSLRDFETMLLVSMAGFLSAACLASVDLLTGRSCSS